MQLHNLRDTSLRNVALCMFVAVRILGFFHKLSASLLACCSKWLYFSLDLIVLFWVSGHYLIQVEGSKNHVAHPLNYLSIEYSVLIISVDILRGELYHRAGFWDHI